MQTIHCPEFTQQERGHYTAAAKSAFKYTNDRNIYHWMRSLERC